LAGYLRRTFDDKLFIKYAVSTKKVPEKLFILYKIKIKKYLNIILNKVSTY
jgi:hypothetical protein